MRKIMALGMLSVALTACSELPIDSLSRSGWDAPTSLPPAGYDHHTWVDQRGCVFFKTGTGWVPHVGAKLKQVCK